MSIFLERNKLKSLENFLQLSIIEDTNGKIVASACNKKLYFKDYTEEKLKKFVEKYENSKVNYIFWNYNYCTLDNLILDDINKVMKKLSITQYKNKQFTAGYIISIINFYNILYELYNNPNFNIDDIKIDKINFKNLLIESKDTYIVSDNFLKILEKIFDGNNIHLFLFKKDNSISLDECKIILNKIKIIDLDICCKYLFKYVSDFNLRLSYLNIILDSYDEYDYSEEYVYIDDITSNMGFLLINMSLPDGQLTIKYTDVINKYINFKGPLKFTYSNELYPLKEKVDKRLKLI